MKRYLVTVLFLVASLPAFSLAPVCLFQDLVTGQASGGEGGNGVYISIIGVNFGATQGSSTVTVNGTAVAQYLYWGPDVTGLRQKIGVQISSATAGAGHIVVTTPGGNSTCPDTFTVRTGNIWYIGSGIDNDTPGSTCASILNGTAGDGNGGNGTYATPFKLTSTPNIDTYSQPQTYTYSQIRTPYTYYHCITAGDSIVFLDGVSYIYGDGDGNHGSLNLNLHKGAVGAPLIIEARPGATVQIGGTGTAAFGFRFGGDTNVTISGINATGSGTTSGSAINADSSTSDSDPTNVRLIGNVATCPDCDGSAAAVDAGWNLTNETSTVNVNNELLGNWVYNIGCSTASGTSDKEFHFIYTNGNGQEIAWNKIGGTGSTAGCAQNGIQINYYQDNNTVGYGNLSVHDNDISQVYGAGINLPTVDPGQGPINVYNNVIHHTGVIPVHDGGSFFTCIAIPGYGTTAATGNVNVYNNTMYDCSAYLNTANTYKTASCALNMGAGQSGVFANLVNNIIYQPSYTYSSQASVLVCGAATANVNGNNNIWYSAATCLSGCTTIPAATGTVTDPLMTAPASGVFSLTSSSPARAPAGSASLFPALDFASLTRPNPPAIGALEYPYQHQTSRLIGSHKIGGGRKLN